VRAIMSIAVEGRRAQAVMRALQGFPEVEAVHTTNGRWDMVAELSAADLEAFSRALDKIRLIEGIASSETSLLLESRQF
jgi:DNA-binding Lrp family transcriptional regulator